MKGTPVLAQGIDIFFMLLVESVRAVTGTGKRRPGQRAKSKPLRIAATPPPKKRRTIQSKLRLQKVISCCVRAIFDTIGRELGDAGSCSERNVEQRRRFEASAQTKKEEESGERSVVKLGILKGHNSSRITPCKSTAGKTEAGRSFETEL